MKNVEDLNMTSGNESIADAPHTQQTISLSALNNRSNTEHVSINATNGLTGVNESNDDNRPVVRINPNRRSNPSSRKVVDAAEVNKAMPQAPKTKMVTPKDIAMNNLAEAVTRKRQEYKEFVESAIEEDKVNREAIEDGLKTVKEDEFQYMPEQLQTEMDESQKVKSPVMDAELPDNHYDFDAPETQYTEDFDEYDDNPDLVTPATSNMQIDSNPFDDEDDTQEEYYENNISEENYEEEPTEEIIEEESVEVPEKEEYEDSTEANEDTRSNSNEIEENVKSDEEITDDDTEEEFGIDGDSITVTESALDEKVHASSSDFDIDEADFEDVSVDTDENLTDEELVKIAEASEKNLRSEILHKIVNTGKKLNTSQFSVSTKVVSIKNALKNSASKPERTATWPLTFAGRPYISTALKGPEIALMADADNSGDSGVGLTISQARIMFEHDANPYRPNTLEAWTKTIPFADVENVFAAIYLASIQGANYIPMACPKKSCQYAYLSDDSDINSMVKFSSDKSEKRFNEIKQMKLTSDNTASYESVINVINDNFAVGLKLPSIYTILYEYNSLNSEFVNKYTAMVSIIQYIDYMYMIDNDTNQLVPIGWKNYHGDHTKTFKSKIATYAKILKEFDDTDFSILMALINSMITKAAENRNLSFEIPAAKCPKCGAEIEARTINPRGMVFMRQRLVELATTPTER